MMGANLSGYMISDWEGQTFEMNNACDDPKDRTKARTDVCHLPFLFIF